MLNRGLIIDLGMHIGQDTEFYLAKGFRVVAVEANPLLARQGEEKFRDAINAGRLTILNVGIGAHAGVFPFYVNKHLSEWSSFDEAIGSRLAGSTIIDVKMITVETLMEQYGTPYYLKVDIEGADEAVIERLNIMTRRPKFISVENGFPSMLRTFVELGYDAFKFINQAKIAEIQCPVPALEGNDIPWAFPPGSSGPFGEDTPSVWKNASEVLEDIKAYWDMPNRDDNIHGWYDLHARLA